MSMSPERTEELDAIFNGASLIRDRYDRPLLVPSEWRAADPLVRLARGDEKRHPGKLPYTRASSFANYVADHSAIDTWQKRSLTKGMGEREDLAALAAGLPPIISNTRDKAGMSKDERRQDDATNKALDEIAEEAMKHANRDFKANWGTAIHSFTDPGGGTEVPARMKADVDSWWKAALGWTFHGTETFVQNDTYQSAGSFDHLISIPWLPELGRIIVDKKTGLLHPDQFSIQQTVYATGVPYDVTTDEREQWPDGIAPNQDVAIIAHVPLGLGRTDLYFVDLTAGRVGCEAATAVRSYRQRRDADLMWPFDPQAAGRQHVGSLVAVADSPETMRAIFEEYRVLWNADLKALAQQRIAHLEAE